MKVFSYKGKPYKLTTAQYNIACGIRAMLGTHLLGDAFAESFANKGASNA